MSWLDAACGAGLGSLFDSLGLATPGNRPPKPKRNGPKRTYPCICASHPSAIDGTIVFTNCGQRVRRHGGLIPGHDGGEGYDREAILKKLAEQARLLKAKKKAQRVNDELMLLKSLTLDGCNSSQFNLAQKMTEIKKKHADILLGPKFALYPGLSKQSGEYAKSIRGEPGRFLWESKDIYRRSTNTPIIQWRLSWYDRRTVLLRGELEWHGFKTRIVYHSRVKAHAALVEKAIQGARYVL